MLGAFCVSIDLELGWGIWDKPDDTYFERCASRERDIVHSLLRMFDAHEVPATWAIVGRLLELDESRARSTRYGDRLWYAPDLIEAVQHASIRHDIGSHSYGHIYFNESSTETARTDLAAARRVHDQHGLPFESFVFPRNHVAHVALLREVGVRVFRSVDQGWHIDVRNRFGKLAGRLAHLAGAAMSIAPATIIARPAGELVDLPSSMLFIGRKGMRRAVPGRALVSRARRALHAAVEHGECFHLWLHPSNFYHRTAAQLAAFSEILRNAAELAKRGRLEVRTMRDYANATQA